MDTPGVSSAPAERNPWGKLLGACPMDQMLGGRVTGKGSALLRPPGSAMLALPLLSCWETFLCLELLRSWGCSARDEPVG